MQQPYSKAIKEIEKIEVIFGTDLTIIFQNLTTCLMITKVAAGQTAFRRL